MADLNSKTPTLTQADPAAGAGINRMDSSNKSSLSNFCVFILMPALLLLACGFLIYLMVES